MTMLAHLHEPNETRLGQSKGSPNGRGWGERQARQLYDALARSKAIRSGLLRDIGDLELFLPGIAEDKISDLAINVIRSELVAYTQEQCELRNVPTEEVPAKVFWNPDDERWEATYAQLPVYKDEGLILVPKIAIRRRLVPDGMEYYTHHILPFLQAEHISAKSALVTLLRNGERKVFKKDLKAESKYGYSKEFLLEFSEKNPRIFKNYKTLLPKKVEKPETDFVIESRQRDPRQAASADLAQDLENILPGREHAARYHDFIKGVLTECLRHHSLDLRRNKISMKGERESTFRFITQLQMGSFQNSSISINISFHMYRSNSKTTRMILQTRNSIRCWED